MATCYLGDWSHISVRSQLCSTADDISLPAACKPPSRTQKVSLQGGSFQLTSGLNSLPCKQGVNTLTLCVKNIMMGKGRRKYYGMFLPHPLLWVYRELRRGVRWYWQKFACQSCIPDLQKFSLKHSSYIMYLLLFSLCIFLNYSVPNLYYLIRKYEAVSL